MIDFYIRWSETRKREKQEKKGIEKKSEGNREKRFLQIWCLDKKKYEKLWSIYGR